MDTISNRIKNILASPKLLLILSICLSTILGFTSGNLFAKSFESSPSHPIQFTDEINPYVPYLRILGIKEKELVLETTHTGLRIENGEEILSAPQASTFRISIPEYQETLPQNSLQAPCPYVASATGKYVYESASPRAARISKGKRCFTDLSEAEKLGLTLWKEK